MTEYKVVTAEVTSIVWRDVKKAADDLTAVVNAEIAKGWLPQGGIASIQAGTTVHLIQAMTTHK